MAGPDAIFIEIYYYETRSITLEVGYDFFKTNFHHFFSHPLTRIINNYLQMKFFCEILRKNSFFKSKQTEYHQPVQIKVVALTNFLKNPSWLAIKETLV